jgi:23S rRNA pseudouridine1911/1915/1917 synthase
LPAGASPALVDALEGFRRQALHAARLKLEHPLSGKEMEWEAPLPGDMQALLKIMEADTKAANEGRR